ncbi:hypothetical protein L207DRAFT_79820 [Hyaloscypha variabilis F]|uniref:Uncharacterized protein n=1 Tax=Hyaloscypha variabilis (strain UAMH 11265 / GT02V1 / F) TaxID=1149755 RepID=A0A2J6RGK3_HYAVF|nr:hypothetical protein L207DRAFT_79820 [Hyaloscypha variabilis F]
MKEKFLSFDPISLPPAISPQTQHQTRAMATTTPDQASEGGNKQSRDDASYSPPIKRVKKDKERTVGDKKEQEEQGSTDSLFGSPTTTSQECTICLEAFHEREGEGKILEPCDHPSARSAGSCGLLSWRE